MLKTYYPNDELLEKYSVAEGLNELQKDFLKREMNKKSKLPISTLRRKAKKKAAFQRVKWFAEDALTAITMLGAVVAVILVLLIFAY